jgi:hypothetical protein
MIFYMLLLFQWYAAKHDKETIFTKICNSQWICHWINAQSTTVDNGQWQENNRVIAEREVTDLLKAMIAPIRPYGSIFSYTGGAQKSLRGNYHFFKWIRTGLEEL